MSHATATNVFARLAKYGFAISLVACFVAVALHLKECYYRFSYCLDTEPEHYSIFRDLFREYGCETKEEFLAFLAENSYPAQGWELVDNVVKPKTIYRYNETASVANERYNYMMDTIVDRLISDPVYFLEPDMVLIGALVAIPIICLVLWIILRKRAKMNNAEI